MTLTHVSEVIEEIAETIVVVEDDVQCDNEDYGQPRCPLRAEWDLISVCAAGCVDVVHNCTAHKDLWLSFSEDDMRCTKHPRPYPHARFVAVYPRRRS